jgi:hypothetical protein
MPLRVLNVYKLGEGIEANEYTHNHKKCYVEIST